MMNTTGAFQTRGHVERLVEGPDVRRAVAEERQRDVRACPASGTPTAAPTAIGRPAPTMALAPMLPLREVDQVHRAADAARAAGRLAHQLGERRLGRHPERERLAVAAIRVRLDVARAHRGDRPDRHRLLALAQVGRALPIAPLMNSSWTFSSKWRIRTIVGTSRDAHALSSRSSGFAEPPECGLGSGPRWRGGTAAVRFQFRLASCHSARESSTCDPPSERMRSVLVRCTETVTGTPVIRVGTAARVSR